MHQCPTCYSEDKKEHWCVCPDHAFGPMLPPGFFRDKPPACVECKDHWHDMHIQESAEFVVAEKDKEKNMGNNTTVLILNDFTGSIKKSEKFVERLCQMLSSGEVGDVIPGVKIIETHHADDTVRVRVGGNRCVVENDASK